MSFNERLRELRKIAGLSQDGLAKAAGLSTDTVSKLERPGKEPAWDTAVKLAAVLGVPLDAFKDVDNAPAAPKKPRKANVEEPAADAPDAKAGAAEGKAKRPKK